MDNKPELPTLPDKEKFIPITIEVANALLLDYKDSKTRLEFSVVHPDESHEPKVILDDDSVVKPFFLESDGKNTNDTHVFTFDNMKDKGGLNIPVSPVNVMMTRQQIDGGAKSALVICWESKDTNNQNFIRLVS